MDEHAAVLGLALLAGLAWGLPPGLRAAKDLLRSPEAVIYAESNPPRLLWSPGLPSPESGVRDGQVRGPDGAPVKPVGGWPGLLLGNPLDLNAATQTDLEALPGIGPRTAEAIREERARRGAFRSVEELLAVKGVGPATLERLRTLVRVGSSGGSTAQGPNPSSPPAGRRPVE